MQADKSHAMSVSNTICFVIFLLETGVLPIEEQETIVNLDTPADLVRTVAWCRDGMCETASIEPPTSFVLKSDLVVSVPDCGNATVEIVFVGIFCGLIDVNQFELSIEPKNARRLVELGTAI